MNTNHKRNYYRKMRYKYAIKNKELDKILWGEEYSSYKNLNRYSKNKIIPPGKKSKLFNKTLKSPQEVRKEDYMKDIIKEYIDII